MVKTLLVISLVFVVGVAGVTVAAAQGSQPGEPIYALKVWSDQAHTLLQTRVQAQTAQMTSQSEANLGLQERDCIRLQTQDPQQVQECDCNRLQTQDPQQVQERERIRLQTQDLLQTQERIQQSLNNGQQNRGGGQPNPGYGNRP